MLKAKTQVLENVDVECTHCGVTMTSTSGGGGTIRYFQCPKCQRWVSSMYTEVFRADTKVRPRAAVNEGRAAPSGSVRERLQAWLRTLDAGNPYRVLGCQQSDSIEVVRERYRALARRHHPDAGGDERAMLEVNEAFQRILLERKRLAGPGQLAEVA